MEDEFVLIQYFAIQDKNEVYRDVVEISQEISEIKKLQDEKRLLNWG